MAPVAIEPTHAAPVAVAGKTPSAEASTLDYAQWAGPSASPASKGAFVAQLREACAGLGFFYLTNTPLDEGDLRARVFALNQAFFDLPLAVRQRISIVNSPHFRGFSKFGDERTQNAVDHRDQIDYGLEAEPVGGSHSPPPSSSSSDENSTRGQQWAALVQAYPFLNLIGPNQFLPDEVLPDHRELVLRWLELCQGVTREMTAALESALGTRSGELLRFLTGDTPAASGIATDKALAAELHRKPHLYARAKTIRYPTAASIDGVSRLKGSTQGVGAHKDGGWITLLATSAHRGLQVQSLDGTWLDVVHHPHALIVNFGQQIERVSRGAISAATHRVLSGAEPSSSSSSSNGAAVDGGERFSVAFFSMPALNSVVEPIAASSLSPAIRDAWRRAQEERKRLTGNDAIVTDVPAGDLWGSDDAPFGFQAWKGITRSHPNVVERYRYDT